MLPELASERTSGPIRMTPGFTTNKATHVVNFRKRLSALEMQGSLLSCMMGPAHEDVAFSHDSLVKNQVLLLQLVRP
jgi:hypothetical protein